MFVLNCFINDEFKATEMFPTITEAMQKAANFANEYDMFQVHISKGGTRTFLKGKSNGQTILWVETHYSEKDKDLPGKKIKEFMLDEGIHIC